MAVKRKHLEKETAYFVTFTCIDWLNLIQESDSYNSFYNWFNVLKQNDVAVLAYVIMPNHFHGIFYVKKQCDIGINQLVANGKRFIAYDIVKELREKNKSGLVSKMEEARSVSEINRNKKHKVFKTSFDCVEIEDSKMKEIKIDYMHKNPNSGKWNLVEDYVRYKHSSAVFYEEEIENCYVEDYRGYY